jgi:hypothetical protein
MKTTEDIFEDRLNEMAMDINMLSNDWARREDTNAIQMIALFEIMRIISESNLSHLLENLDEEDTKFVNQMRNMIREGAKGIETKVRKNGRKD